MSRFIKNGYKVAYIEPSFSIVRKPDIYKINYQTNRPFSVSVEQKNDNLFIVKPPRGMPFWSNPVISRLNYYYFAFKLSRVLKRLKFDKYILFIYRPEYAPGVDLFDYSKLVIDITDDLAAFKQKEPGEYKYINKCKEHNIQRSDLVIVTAATLYEKYRDMSKNISLIPNGYDPGLFSDNDAEVPDEIKSINTPIIGFIGTLFSFLDYDLLEYIIKNNSDKTFIFIGHLEENSRSEWTGITNKYKNVLWLGKKRKEDIPAYIKRFDVCINPFKVDNVSRSVSPLKVFEYLAMKKPVISVRMESLEKEEVAPFISFASSYQEFNEKLQVALNDKDTFSDKLNYSVVEKYSWDNLFKQVISSVENL